MSSDHEYVLGTHDEEIARLGLQHRVWRPHAVDAWRRAGFGAGQTILDVGCGPGYASLDLAQIAGRDGRVIAVDQSRRFLDALTAAAANGGVTNIETFERDLNAPDLPGVRADGAWVRWVFAFVRDPRALLERIAARVLPGASIAIHEYLQYESWQLLPPSAELDLFVRTVMDSWRRSGGEPNVAVSLPRWLEELDFEITHLQPIIEVTSAGQPKWAWTTAFLESGRRRLAELGELTPEQSETIGLAVARWPSEQPPVRMITPAVLEIVAVRR